MIIIMIIIIDAHLFLQGNIQLIDKIVNPIITSLTQTVSHSLSQFIHTICDFYQAMIAGIQEHGRYYLVLNERIDEAMYFNGDLPTDAIQFLVFFRKYQEYPVIQQYSPSYDEWLVYFLKIIDRIIEKEEENDDCNNLIPCFINSNTKKILFVRYWLF